MRLARLLAVAALLLAACSGGDGDRIDELDEQIAELVEEDDGDRLDELDEQIAELVEEDDGDRLDELDEKIAELEATGDLAGWTCTSAAEVDVLSITQLVAMDSAAYMSRMVGLLGTVPLHAPMLPEAVQEKRDYYAQTFSLFLSISDDDVPGNLVNHWLAARLAVQMQEVGMGRLADALPWNAEFGGRPPDTDLLLQAGNMWEQATFELFKACSE